VVSSVVDDGCIATLPAALAIAVAAAARAAYVCTRPGYHSLKEA
jgi:hypothetical protein